MAHPWIFESTFGTGDNSEWDSETDTAAQLDFPSYRELAAHPWPGSVPQTGAYCMRASLTGGTADAFVQEGDINVSATARRHFRFGVYFSPTFDATSDDTMNLFELQDTSNVVEAVVGFRYVAATDVINLGIGEVAPTSFTGFNITKGIWWTIEMDVTLDDGGSNDGTIDLFVTPSGSTPPTAVSATQVASLNQGAVTHGVLGIQNHLSTTTGIILIDNFVMDDARIFPIRDRYPETVLLSKTGHAFVGPGVIENIRLTAGAGTDCVLDVYDSDTANSDDIYSSKIHMENTANTETVNMDSPPESFSRGGYVVLSGTNPRAWIKLKRAIDRSQGAVRNLGRARGGKP